MLQAIPGCVVLCQAVGSDVYTDMIYLFDPVCVCVCVYICICMCVCVCLCARQCLCINVHMCFLFMSFCLWVCSATRGKQGIVMHKNVTKLYETER